MNNGNNPNNPNKPHLDTNQNNRPRPNPGQQNNQQSQKAPETPAAETPAETTPEEVVAPTRPIPENVSILFNFKSSKYINGIDAFNLKIAQETADIMTRLLKVQGHVFLNEVLDHLGIKRVSEGQYLGWILSAQPSVKIRVEQSGTAVLLYPEELSDIMNLI